VAALGRKKEEGRRKKDEGRGNKEEGGKIMQSAF